MILRSYKTALTSRVGERHCTLLQPIAEIIFFNKALYGSRPQQRDCKAIAYQRQLWSAGVVLEMDFREDLVLPG
jgi:hypothetical protein